MWNIDPDALKGKLPKFLPDVPEVGEDISDYLGECQAVDAYVGELLKMLEASGEAERTMVVLSGDHGMPGVPHGKCNLYDHGVAVTLAIRVPGGKGGRILDDFVCLPDLAPTFMEIAGVKPPENLYGRSLLPLLKSEKSGLVDETRNWVITGRERHVETAREGKLPYPMRALRTPDYIYIRNFAPDRWPMGQPRKFGDMDGSPTRAWVADHKDDKEAKKFYEMAFGKRPEEELYDVRKDPDMTSNLAGDAGLADLKAGLSKRLMDELTRAKDPRVVTDPPAFDRPPFTD